MLRLLQNAIKLLTICLIVSSCAGIERPDAYIGVVDVPANKIRGYNLKHDYDKSGKRKPSAKPREFRLPDTNNLDKWSCTPNLPTIQAWIEKTQSEWECKKK